MESTLLDSKNFKNIIEALKFAANFTHASIISYPLNDVSAPAVARQLSYKELLYQAEANASKLCRSPQTQAAFAPGSVVLVHFDNALDSIIWYWSVLLAGAIPAMSSPGMLSQNPPDRKKHLRHLYTLLNHPLCLTRRSLLEPFLEQDENERIGAYAIEDLLADSSMIGVVTSESTASKKRKAALASSTTIQEMEFTAKKNALLLEGHEGNNYKETVLRKQILTRETLRKQRQDVFSKPRYHQRTDSDIVALMLTSGTSGNSKAVALTHRQILAALRGKEDIANLSHKDSPFMSWVNMDHVANLVHCHLFAIVAGVSQIQVSAVDMLSDPMQFLNLLSRHRVSRTFAPNFFFAKLLRQLESGKDSALDPDLNLEALYLDTGGEANVVDVCLGLQQIFSKYGASDDVFHPSFGMTETCAGCIFNNWCPSYEAFKNLEFVSLGKPMPGVQMRVMRIIPDSGDHGSLVEAQLGERGHLEVTGDVVFKEYYNDPKATAEAFTPDGWFRTGDLAYLDDCGNLHLDGRTKEMININGVKYLPYELDAALEQANIFGATPSYFCCFSRRDLSMDTEAVVVIYLPSFDQLDDEARFKTESRIIRVVSTHTHSQPQVIPLREQDMKKSTLGKLSRVKLKDALEKGAFIEQQSLNEAAIKRYRQKIGGEPETAEEATILHIIRNQLELGEGQEFFVNDSILSMGATSMDLMALVSRINKKMQLSPPIELIDLLRGPTAKDIATRIASISQGTQEYDPVVTLQPHGTKTPLWLVHPGVGEVLVFVNLVPYITDRPIYAFRTKGMARGEISFKDLSEMFHTYYSFIKKGQPKGPYAIAGYSFGGMVAFELTKLLEAEGEEVRYCGSWNLPPHIKSRMRDLVWDQCLMHLFYFVELMTEKTVYKHEEVIREFDRQGKRLEAIEYLRPFCDQTRWKHLGLSNDDYLHWIGVAAHNQSLAVEYEPMGNVKCMDVFVANPLGDIGVKDRQDWVENRLMAWEDFVREDVQFHEVDGAHWNMLNPGFVDVGSFAKTLQEVLAKRGL